MPILINDNTARVQYTATAGQTVFIVPYEFFEVGDLKVYNGDTLLAYNVTPSSASQYSVTGAGVTGGGSITLGAPGATISSVITIVRDIPIKRLTDFPNAGPFNIQALNAELDKLTAVQQNLETDLDNRVIRLGDSDTPNTLSALPNKAARQNKLLGFDVQGQPVAYDTASLATLVAYATAFADTFTGNGSNTTFTLSGDPAVIANLDVSINGVTQVPLTDYTLSGTTLTTTTAVPNGAVMLVKFKEGLPNYSGDAQDIRYTAGFSGAVQQSVQTKLEQYVSVKDFGAVGDGVADDTAAFDAAETYLGTVGGGIMFVPPGTYKINWVCTTENIIVQGSGGRGEYDDTCIRPYSLASAPITIGNGTAYVRYVSLLDCHVSGSDGSVSGETTAANNAPQAILLNGGTVNFHADRCVFYNGLKTVSLVPSVTLPVTTNVFLNSTIRNDLTDSANARAIYIIRLADPGYATANKFIATKLNGPTLGYAAEIDGTVAGITFEVNDSYWDIKPAKGVLLKGASGIVCHNFQIDPGTTAAIIIETDNNGDIARFISGLLRHGGQKFQTPAYTYDIPAEADIFSYRQRALSPFLGNDVVFSTTADPYNTSVNLSLQSSTGPLAFYGANFTPGVNNSQSIGNSTQRWSNVYGYNIRAGDGTAFWTTGTGSPEGVVTAPVGSIFTRLNGGALTTLYIKESGAGNTGWVAK